MKIEVERVTSWQRVLNAARFTVRKDALQKEPSDEFKKAIIFAEHSPIRLLEFDVRVYDVPKFIIMHLVRHNQGIEKFVSTSRPDRTGNKIPRHEQRADDLINCQFSLNAQAFINISKVRLCRHAERETRELWLSIVKKLYDIEPILAHACHPSCVYRNVCPELRSCGYDYRNERSAYIEDFRNSEAISKAPKETKHFDPGQKVLVPYYDGYEHRWRLTIYSHYEEGRKKHVTVNGVYMSDEKIISYESNKDKLGKPVNE